jgi:transposase
MKTGDDPTARCRLDRERQNDRDAVAWKLQRQGWSVRAIARELKMPASSVQRCLQRVQKRLADELAETQRVRQKMTDALARW